MRVVVLQPSYLPYAGVFALIDLADVFVFYDDVQFVKQSWQQRNRIKTDNGQLWLTVPVQHNLGQRICDTRIAENSNWSGKHYKSLLQNYGSTEQWPAYEDTIKNIYDITWNYLSDLNIYAIKMLTMALEIKEPRYLYSSRMSLTGQATERLIMLLKEVGATEYISGMAGRRYIEPAQFREAEIKLTWFRYEHSPYPQIKGGDFLPYMSIIDLMCNVPHPVEYIRGGVRFED